MHVHVVRTQKISFPQVLLGGGHAHVHVLKMLGMQPIANTRITLISKDVNSPFVCCANYVKGSQFDGVYVTYHHPNHRRVSDQAPNHQK